MKNILITQAKSVLIPLGLTTAALATALPIQNKIYGSDMTTLIFSNNEMDDIMKEGKGTVMQIGKTLINDCWRVFNVSWKFVICAEAITYLLLYNLNDCTFKSFVKLGLFVKDINETTEKEAIGQKYGNLRMLFDVLTASLSGIVLVGKIKISEQGVLRVDERSIITGQDF